MLNRRGRSAISATRNTAGRLTLGAHPGRTNALLLVPVGLFLTTSYLALHIGVNPDVLRTRAFPNGGSAILALGIAAGAEVLLAAAFRLHDRAVVRGTYNTVEPGALVPPMLRPFLWLVVLPCLAGVAVLTSRVAGTRGPLGVDRAVDDRLVYRLRPFTGLFRDLTQLGSPLGVGVLSALLAGICLAVGQRRAALLSITGPPLAGTLTEYVLKPAIGRQAGHLFAFPSGHTTGAVAVAAVIGMFLLPNGPLASRSTPFRFGMALLAAILASGVPIGLIVLRYHYATDVLAGAAVALASTLLAALTLDRIAGGRGTGSVSRFRGPVPPPHCSPAPEPAAA